jgi:hypothetical protein
MFKFDSCWSLGIFQIGGVEAFREPILDPSQQCARFGAAISIPQESRELRGRAAAKP